MKPDYSKLPKSWGVFNDNSVLFREKVVACMNSIQPGWTGDALDCYYGINTDGSYDFTKNIHNFSCILTLQRFIDLTEGKEEFLPKVGDMILVRDNESHEWKERIFLAHIPRLKCPWIIVDGYHTDIFKDTINPVNSSSYKFAKPLPKQLTKDEISAMIGMDSEDWEFKTD